MLTFLKKVVTDGSKHWDSAAFRLKRDVKRAFDPLDKITVDSHALYSLVLPDPGSACEPRLVIDLFLELEAEKADPAAIVWELLEIAASVLRSPELANFVFEVEMESGMTGDVTAADVADRLDALSLFPQSIHELRKVLELELGEGKFYGRTESLFAKVRARLTQSAYEGNAHAACLLAILREHVFKSVLAPGSMKNSLISYIDPYLLADVGSK